MKILQICARIPFPVDDGGALYVFNTTKYLQKLGHKVTVASFFSNRHRQDPDSFRDYCNELYFEDGNFSNYHPLAALKSILTRTPISIQHRMNSKIMDRILSNINSSFDVILLEGLHVANFTDLIKEKFKNTPIVLRHVNVEYQLLERNAELEKNLFVSLFLKDQAKLMKRFELQQLNKVDAITFISDVDHKHLSTLLPDKPSLISPPGAILLKNLNFEDREKQHLLAFSNWKWKPNADGLNWFLQNVWETLKSEFPNLKLTLTGSDLDNHIVKNLPEDIFYKGFVENLNELKRKATIQIVPLISGSGVKLKVLEGLSAGLPIISTKFGVDGIEAKNGIHFELGNTPKEFISKIRILLKDKDKRGSLSTNAQQLIKEKYTWPKQIKELECFLEQII